MGVTELDALAGLVVSGFYFRHTYDQQEIDLVEESNVVQVADRPAGAATGVAGGVSRRGLSPGHQRKLAGASGGVTA